ncbi:hypothetical protein DSECCO2_221530 [anaerobic digester metagenome]
MCEFLQSNLIYEDIEKVTFSIKKLYDSEFDESIKSFVQELIKIKSERDVLIVKTDQLENSLKIDASNHEDLLDSYLEEIDLCTDETDMIDFTFEIIKQTIDGVTSIYSLNVFGGYLNSLAFEDILGKLQDSFQDTDLISFELIMDKGSIYTKRFSFSDLPKTEAKFQENYNRKSILKLKDSHSNYNGYKRYDFTPDDFFVLENHCNTEIVKTLFNKIAAMLSFEYISNLSRIEANRLEYKIDGYKCLTGKIEFKDIAENDEYISVLHEIYQWVYTEESNVSDKLGIARNIISLNIRNSDITYINKSILSSIKSGYEIYLKENVERYIEVMNQQVIFLNSINENISELATEFSNKFRNSFIGFFTFVFTTIVFNIITTGKINNIFTKEITWITLGLLSASILYMVFSILEVNSKKNRLEKKYNRNKEYYELILDKEDLERMMKNDQYFKDDCTFLFKSIRNWICCWLIIVAIIITILYKVGTF